MFHEKWVPYSLEDLPEGESIRLDDLDGFIPYLTQKWPEGGRPHRHEVMQPGPPRPNPVGVDGWIVFRVPPPKPAPVDPTAPVVNWDAVLRERTRDQPED